MISFCSYNLKLKFIALKAKNVFEICLVFPYWTLAVSKCKKETLQQRVGESERAFKSPSNEDYNFFNNSNELRVGMITKNDLYKVTTCMIKRMYTMDLHGNTV